MRKGWRPLLIGLVTLIGCATHLSANEPSEVATLKARLLYQTHPDSLALLYSDLAWEYTYLDFDSAMHYAQLGVGLGQEVSNINIRATCLEMMAILKEMSGLGEDALNIYLQVIPLREQIGGSGLENTYNNMALIFRDQGNWKKALEYFNLSYEIELRNGNSTGEVASLINIGIANSKLFGSQAGIQMFYKAQALLRNFDDSDLQCDLWINMADIHQLAGSADSALNYYGKALKLTEEQGKLGAHTATLIGMALSYKSIGKYALAERLLNEALQDAKKMHFLNYLLRIYSLQGEIFALTGRHEDAYRAQKQYTDVKDSLFTMEIIKLTGDLEARYQGERKERQIAELQLESIQAGLREEKQRNQRNVFISLAVILLLFGAFILKGYATSRKNSAVLTEKNRVIENALRDRELLLKEIHHRVKNNLQIVSSLLSIQGRNIKDEKALEAVNESRSRVQSMALIHQFLYGDDNLKSIDMQQYVSRLSQSLFDTYKVDHDAVQLKIEVEQVHLDVDTAIPVGLILNELITNSLKYAFPEGREGLLEVSLYEKNSSLQLVVADNGVGMEPEMANEHSFGMKLLNAFKSRLGGEIEVWSDSGTTIAYTIHKYKRLWPKDIEYSS